MEIAVWQVAALLAQAGVPVATVVDCGCAQGYFSSRIAAEQLFPQAKYLNVDPNPVYAQQLAEIAGICGGAFASVAVAEREGTASLTLGEDADWASLRDAKDVYWETLNGMALDAVEVPVTTLDKLTRKFGLEGPYFLKLDVQGGELNALRGARSVLRDTACIAVEVELRDFSTLDRFLAERDFELFDVAELGRSVFGRLIQFYPIFLHRKYVGRFAKNWVPSGQQPELAKSLAVRRDDIGRRISADLSVVRNIKGCAG